MQMEPVSILSEWITKPGAARLLAPCYPSAATQHSATCRPGT